MIGRPPLAVRVAAAGAVAFALAYPLRAAMVAPEVSWLVRTGVIALLVVSSVWRDWRVPALVGAVALVPVFPYFVDSVPRGIVHLLVIAAALPWLVDLVRGREVWPARDSVAVIWGAWLAVGAASVGVALLAGYRPVFEDTSSFSSELHRLATRYVFARPTREIENCLRVWTLLADGLSVYLLVRASTDRLRALRACLLSAAGVAAVALLQAWTGIGLRGRWSSFDNVTRIHGTFSDPNSLGAWLAMSLPPIVVCAFVSRGPWRRVWSASAALVALALVFTGSRSAWGAAIAAMACLAWLVGRAARGITPHAASLVRRAFAIGAVALAVAIIALAAVGTMRDVRQFDQRSYVDTLLYTFNLRQPPNEILKGRPLLWRTALNMLASEPLFGVGLGRSEREFYSFSQYLDPKKPPGFTAHNTFLTVASETGLVGLAALILVLGTIAVAGRRPADGASDSDVLIHHALLAGLLAFVVTMLTGDRFLLREDMVMFAAVAGLALSYSAPCAGARRIASALAALMIAFLVVTTPMHAMAEARAVQLNRVWHGVSAVLREPDDTTFRWTGARATFFVPGSAETLILPIRRAASSPQQVIVRVNGRDADRLTLDTDDWREVRYLLAGAHSSRRFHRVEVLASPLVEVRGQDEPVGVKIGNPRY